MNTKEEEGSSLSIADIGDELDSTLSTNLNPVKDSNAEPGSAENPLEKDDKEKDKDKDTDPEKEKEKDTSAAEGGEGNENDDPEKDKDKDKDPEKDVDPEKAPENKEKDEDDLEKKTDDKSKADYGYLMANKIHSSLGFEEDLVGEEFEKEFGTGVDGISKYVKKVIDESSQVTFPNDEAARYYKFIASGGDVNKLQAANDAIEDYEDISLEGQEENLQMQKDVMYNTLASKNPSKDADWINARITRAENAGTLFDDSKDGLEYLQETSKDDKETLIKTQEKATATKAKESETYWKEEEKAINSAGEIAGIKMTPEVQKKLIQYEKSGKFRTYIKNPEKLRELQLIAMLGLKTLKKSNKSSVVGDLEEQLKTAAQDSTGKGKSNSTSAPPREKSPKDSLEPDWNDLTLE